MKYLRLLFLHFSLLYSSLAWAQLPDFYGKYADPNICTQLNITQDEKILNLVTRILEVYNLDNTYVIQACSSVENCVAAQRNGVQYILYNPDYMDDIRTLSFTESDMPVSQGQWNHLMVLAHEVGHHMNNHLTNPLGLKPREMELKADETAGFILYQLGAPDPETACSALRSPGVSEAGSASHPPREERIAAFRKGWEKAAEKFPRDKDTDGDGIPDNTDQCPDIRGVSGKGGCPTPEMASEELKKIMRNFADKYVENPDPDRNTVDRFLNRGLAMIEAGADPYTSIFEDEEYITFIVLCVALNDKTKFDKVLRKMPDISRRKMPDGKTQVPAIYDISYETYEDTSVDYFLALCKSVDIDISVARELWESEYSYMEVGHVKALYQACTDKNSFVGLLNTQREYYYVKQDVGPVKLNTSYLDYLYLIKDTEEIADSDLTFFESIGAKRTNTTPKLNRPNVTGQVNNIWMEHNVFENGQKGCKIHVSFNVENMYQLDGMCVVFFAFNNGDYLKDYNNLYRTSDGNVCTWESFKPAYTNASFADLVLFMPYDELHLSASSSSLRAFARIFDRSDPSDIRMIAESASVYFNFNK